MLQTLKELQSGALKGTKQLKISCDLKEFPIEILSLADTLEILDLSNNHLSSIPNEIIVLEKLKILFISNNDFIEFPSVLASLPALTMIGIKSNKVAYIPENAFPKKLQWLILTDNQIKTIPKSIGNCTLLQKCALAGNKIETLPIEMANCKNLELLRISANQLKEIPNWLFELPKLSWIAFGGNPASFEIAIEQDLESVDWSEFEIQNILGQGASGIISKAYWTKKNKTVAIKAFKGEVTSDGLPNDELNASILAGKHKNLVPILGKTKNHPQNKKGLIMELIPPTFKNLGNPPSFNTCTRDFFDQTNLFHPNEILKIAIEIASVCEQLHQKGINHGDLYAHNILINNEADSILGDFGAASFYNRSNPTAQKIERIEVRAFGCLIEDLESLVKTSERNNHFQTQWYNIIKNCFHPNVEKRNSFSDIIQLLKQIKKVDL